jgi:hypothetical protein
MKRLMNGALLKQENGEHAGTGGRSQENKGLGVHPAFLDTTTCTVYRSRFADGRPAPFHMLDGLPDELIVARSASGRVVAAKGSLVSGFERNGFFYTRAAAARAAAEWPTRS